MNLKQAKIALGKNRVAIAALDVKLIPLQNARIQLYNKGQKLKAKIDKLKIVDAKDKPDWSYILHVDNNQSTEHYRYAEAQLKKLGLGSDGYFRDTKQARLQICLTNGKPETLTSTEAALAVVLPYVKPVEAGFKVLGIFEHTLSADGIYDLLVKKNDYRLRMTTYGRPEILVKWSSLSDALNYIYEHHYYERVREQETANT